MSPAVRFAVRIEEEFDVMRMLAISGTVLGLTLALVVQPQAQGESQAGEPELFAGGFDVLMIHSWVGSALGVSVIILMLL